MLPKITFLAKETVTKKRILIMITMSFKRLLQVLSPDETLTYPAAVALAQECQRRGGEALLAGPLLRHQQEQIAWQKSRWANLPLRPFEETATIRAEQMQLRRLISDFQPDVIHVYGLSALRAVAPSVGKTLFLCTLSDVSRHVIQNGERRRLQRMLSRCQQIFVSSESDHRFLEALGGRLAERAQLLHPPVEIKAISSHFNLDRKRRALGLNAEAAVIGVISPAATGLGLETVLQAAVQITQQFANVEFLLVGDGPERERLALMAHKFGIGGAVVFRGQRADIAEIIASLNVLVIPAEVAGSINYALQALALDIPVVAVPTEALVRVIEPIDPQAFVPPDDVEALVKILSERLEILPPPEDDWQDEEIGLSLSDMLVSSLGFDLDSIGLEPQWRGDASERQLAIQRIQEHFSVRAFVGAVVKAYAL